MKNKAIHFASGTVLVLALFLFQVGNVFADDSGSVFPSESTKIVESKDAVIFSGICDKFFIGTHSPVCDLAIAECKTKVIEVYKTNLNSQCSVVSLPTVPGLPLLPSNLWRCDAEQLKKVIDFTTSFAEYYHQTSIRSACSATQSASQSSSTHKLDTKIYKIPNSLKFDKSTTASLPAVDIYGLHDPADKDLELAGEEICKSFLSPNTNTASDECRASIADCVRHNAGLFESVIKDQNETQFAQKANACEEIKAYSLSVAPYTTIPAHWTCTYKRWQDIVSYMKEQTKPELKAGMETACVVDATSTSGSGSPVTPTPSAPAPGTPPSTGGAPVLSGAGASSASSVEPKEGGCSLSFANGNALSGIVSYLPFFMLMLVFGIKRKNK